MPSPAGPGAQPRWQRSSYSGSTGGQCVEVAAAGQDRAIAVRDSKDPAGPVLSFAPDAWQSFLGGTRRGEFDV